MKRNEMTIEIALQKMRELHDEIKEHPYWRTFDYKMFKNEVCPMYREIMELYSYLRYNKEYEDSDSPFFAMIDTIYHDFSATLSILTYNPRIFETPIEETKEFKEFYLPMLQNFLQLVHFFVEGMNSEDVMIMFMPKNTHSPKHPMIKYVCVKHDNWDTKDGYKFWYGNWKWRAIQEVKRENKEKIINRLKEKIETYKKNKPNSCLTECYIHELQDIEEETNLAFKIVD